MRYFPGPEALHKPICLPIVFPMKRSRPAEDARKQRTVAKDNTSINAAGKGVEDNRVESRKDQGDEHAYAPVEARVGAWRIMAFYTRKALGLRGTYERL